MSAQWPGDYQGWQAADTQSQALLTAEYESNKKRKWIVAAVSAVLTVVLAAAAGVVAYLYLPRGTDQEAEPQVQDPEFAAWADRSYGTFEPFVASGTGSGSLALPEGAKAVYAEFTASDDDGLKALGIDEEGDGNYLVTFEIDDSGKASTVLVVEREFSRPAKRLSVESDGDWEISVKPVSQIQPFTEAGTGSIAMAYTGGPRDLHFTHTGDSDFTVKTMAGDELDGTERLNETGPYDGVLPMTAGPGVVVIETADDWTVTG